MLSFSSQRDQLPLGGVLVALALTLAGCSGENALTGLAGSPSPAPTGASTAAGGLDTISSPAGVHCGTERWPVKTLSDPDAGSVNFNPVPSSVSALRSLPAPASLPESSRVGPTELTVFTVTAQVVEFKVEDDQDIHLVIAEPDDPSATMIVEFPDADHCVGAVSSARAPEMRAARAALVAAFGQAHSSGFTHLSGTATITGVAFFDFPHRQTGVAPNAIELHPVLSFTR